MISSLIIGVCMGDMGRHLGQICIFLVCFVLFIFFFFCLASLLLLELCAYFCDLSLNQLFIQNFEQ